MAEAAYAYSQNTAPVWLPETAGQLQPALRSQPLRQPAPKRRPDIKVLPGAEPNRLPQAKPRLAPAERLIFTISVIFLAAFLAGAYVWLVNDTMRMDNELVSLSQKIDQAETEGHRKEAEYSALSNPQSIQRQATSELKMAPDANPEYLQMTGR